VEVSIHAVSPPLILSALNRNGSVGAAAGAASDAAALGDAAALAATAALAGASSAQAEGHGKASAPSRANRGKILISANPLLMSFDF
jgi:hypothetical protein